jgi:Trypsin-like serine proteases, typically periplasmic, contain C-terminal PDZ domain
MAARKSFVAVAAAAVASLVLSGCTGSSAAHSSAPARPTSSTATATPAGSNGTAALALQSSYESTIRKVLPSVVLIRTSSDLGSGVVFDTKGDIVTNDHVVGTAHAFTVSFAGSTKASPAKLVGTYPVDDLAVIRVSGAQRVTPIHFANSSSVQVGEIVLAIGNPLGLSSSVTNGIVSAVGRTVTEPQGGGSPGATLPDTIQTSAAINPGNSGGALVDLNGNLVGIPTLAATDQQLGGGAAPGIGFAISSDIVKDVAGQLVAHGKVTISHRAALGVEVTTVSGPSGQPAGVGIVAVRSGGAAVHAGLKAGDVITAVDNQPTPTTHGDRHRARQPPAGAARAREGHPRGRQLGDRRGHAGHPAGLTSMSCPIRPRIGPLPGRSRWNRASTSSATSAAGSSTSARRRAFGSG